MLCIHSSAHNKHINNPTNFYLKTFPILLFSDIHKNPEITTGVSLTNKQSSSCPLHLLLLLRGREAVLNNGDPIYKGSPDK